MSPWDVLGWMLVIFIFLAVFAEPIVSIIKALYDLGENYVKHLKTRNILPKEGQIWMQGGSALKIKAAMPGNGDDRIVIKSRYANWDESPEDWKKRVNGRKMYLSYNPKDKI